MAVGMVTGTSTGIGFSTAIALARAGHDVFASVRTPQSASALESAAAKESLSVTVLMLDVTNDESVTEAVARVIDTKGRFDFLVNNAGLGTAGPIEEVPIQEFRLVMETNYFGALRCIKAVLPEMRRRGSGCIVNVSSIAGRVATAPQGAYSASKFALESLSEILAQEVRAFNIRVAVVEPGVVKTPIFEKAATELAESSYPQGRRLQALNSASLVNAIGPDEVAAKIVDVVAGGNGMFRHPVGRDARPFMAWRRMLSDEEWIERNGEPDDELWSESIKRESGVDIRPFLDQPLSPPPATNPPAKPAESPPSTMNTPPVT